MTISVSFAYRPGLRECHFDDPTLLWWRDTQGAEGPAPDSVAMTTGRDETGCSVFKADVSFDAAERGQAFRWTVTANGPDGVKRRIVLSADGDGTSRGFRLDEGLPPQIFELTLASRLGANVLDKEGKQTTRFGVYAPHAQAVELVFGDPASGYIANDGTGCAGAPIPMVLDRTTGIWSIEAPAPDGTPYMYRVTKAGGAIVYRTDLFSRAQAGGGSFNPEGRFCSGTPNQIDGTKSCSLVRDPRRVRSPDGSPVASETFWLDEFKGGATLPKRVEDLVIYELHVGALGFGRPEAGTIDDAIAFIPYLAELGINAVELLPIAEFQSDAGWGYSTTHFAAIEESAGGADRLKHFVRACHQNGIAVLLDVVYNHYSGDADRAEWMYDTDKQTENFCYFYDERDWRYKDGTSFPDGGYVDNQSTGFAPNYRLEPVRQLFISSAAAFATEFHVDGFRVDQTTSIHAYAAYHEKGQAAEAAKAAGVAFLRQWTQTLRLIKPSLFLTAEDHSGWDRVTKPYEEGGLGFDAAWYSDFYHHLVDFGEGGDNWAKLLHNAGYGDGRSLNMSYFAGALAGSADRKVVYNDSHDEAGNSKGSARTIRVAVNFAPLVDATRERAEARVRVAAGLTLLSAGTPMFFMGEEVGAWQPYRYDDFRVFREDFVGLKGGVGAKLFRWYQALIALNRASPAIRSRRIEILVADDASRVIAFRRWDDHDEIIVVASFNDSAFSSGYQIRHPSATGKTWRKVLDSDDAEFGGLSANDAADLLQGAFDPKLPAAGLVVFRATSASP